VSVDLRGHGDSDWAPDGDYSFDAFAEDVRAVSGAMSSPPVIVGASTGGIAALLAAGEAIDPSAIARALVLVDVAHRAELAGRHRVGSFMTAHLDGFASLDHAAEVIASYNPRSRSTGDRAGLAKVLRPRGDGGWVWHWDPAFGNGKFGVDDDVVHAEHARLARAVDSLSLPTLLVRGSRSDVLSEETVRDFLQRAPSAEFADVAGAGHMVAGDRNEVFNAAILSFLDQQLPEGSD
jgi:pimeloyl-ACP methyl ester carboxylesterase